MVYKWTNEREKYEIFNCIQSKTKIILIHVALPRSNGLFKNSILLLCIIILMWFFRFHFFLGIIFSLNFGLVLCTFTFSINFVFFYFHVKTLSLAQNRFTRFSVAKFTLLSYFKPGKKRGKKRRVEKKIENERN